MGDEPRRTRLAIVLLRVLVLAALLACIAAAPDDARLVVAVAVAAGLALLTLLASSGWLRSDGVLREQAAHVVVWLVIPGFLMLPRRDDPEETSRDPAESIADIADALVALCPARGRA